MTPKAMKPFEPARHARAGTGLRPAVHPKPRLAAMVESEELDRLREAAAIELADPDRWGTTFTLVQSVRLLPPPSGTAPRTRPASRGSRPRFRCC